jgi:hypothetical protein
VVRIEKYGQAAAAGFALVDHLTNSGRAMSSAVAQQVEDLGDRITAVGERVAGLRDELGGSGE